MNIGRWEEREDGKDTCIKMKKVVGYSNEGERGKNGKDKKIRPI